MLLGNILKKRFFKISRGIAASSAQPRFCRSLPRVRFPPILSKAEETDVPDSGDEPFFGNFGALGYNRVMPLKENEP